MTPAEYSRICGVVALTTLGNSIFLPLLLVPMGSYVSPIWPKLSYLVNIVHRASKFTAGNLPTQLSSKHDVDPTFGLTPP